MRVSIFSWGLLILLLVVTRDLEAWTSSPLPRRSSRSMSPSFQVRPSTGTVRCPKHALRMTDSSSASIDKVFSAQELDVIQSIVQHAGDKMDLEQALVEALPKMHPSLIMKLKQTQGQHENSAVAQVSQSLNQILNQQLEQAKQTLTELLNAGEIRKLDALIGKAAREKRLDAAFFNVLTANLQAAMSSDASSAASAETGDGEASAASRTQILQHVYTRCQEEVEKTIPPGTALLNKLLRTEQPSIRSNLYKHYLVESSEPKTISTPDGKTIKLKPATPQALVSLDEFVSALATAVEQIRTVQQAGGTDRVTAAALVESCRSVAKEARIVLGNEYGPESSQVKQFEEGLQPVFRPKSADSPYIKGV